ncbi:MAG: glycoside hydrolase family 3 C-terminal domain-containing protein [Spirochaetaceae bacterium]|jgi:beta-glucosidase|nr:glycoside hydrolase family 3 C-terminal domain-containing protein [Spirochaetaceae bacterium]
MNAKEIVGQLSLEEKASLCSGLDFWHLKGLANHDLPSIMVTDGPHGLRKQEGASDHVGLNMSKPATCFTPACAIAASFNPENARQIGAAVGEECQAEDIAVVLGPAVNIKRNPLCGRNFEYLSEDPYLAGDIAAAHIQGVQSQGIGVSMKHYAANNQEQGRMVSNSCVDERALREIYLKPFEIAVKKANPATLMCSYNQIDGTYAAENKKILTDIPRDEWGFKGLIMTDWGAIADRAKGIVAGLDLEMPSSGGRNDAKIVEAVQNGTLDVAALDACVERVVQLILDYKANHKAGASYDKEEHHQLCRKAACDAAVLLKNAVVEPVETTLLPLKTSSKVAIIGAFAEKPRFQGGGSSKINPHKVDNALNCLKAAGVQFEYAPGYSLKPMAPPDDALIKAAVEAAKGKDAAIIFAGLPDEYESEGYDRKNLAMPEAHNKLIAAVAEANPNTVVVLMCGAPVFLPWASKVKSILLMYLGGQAVNSAVVDLLFAKANPGGKLPETWFKSLADIPNANYYPGAGREAFYKESIYIGYRWADAAKREPAYPFGFGLSYTTFAISDVSIKAGAKSARAPTLSATVTNTGKIAGSEVLQVYVGKKDEAAGASPLFRAPKELKGFAKVYLEPGESKKVAITIDEDAFKYFNSAANCWATEGGKYSISLGTSSRDIVAEKSIDIEGDGKEALLGSLSDKTKAYFNLPASGSFNPPEAEWLALYNKPIPEVTSNKKGRYDMLSTLGDVQNTWFGKNFIKGMRKNVGNVVDESDEASSIAEAMMLEMPLRALVNMSGGSITDKQADAFITLFNGHYIKGFAKLLKK